MSKALAALCLSAFLTMPSLALAVTDWTSAPGRGLKVYREDHPPGTRGELISDTAQSEPGARADKVHDEQCALAESGFGVDIPFCD